MLLLVFAPVGVLQLRQRYRGIYENFSPDCCYWGLVLLTRKLLFAVIIVLCDRRVALQVLLAA